ncbi:DUF6083 domain-containing protein [Frankia sp. CiP3]|uniref:DUF6083 domain-containing protein n=2 Tax=Frankia TaxID=1854 RepID=UPI0035B3F85C
MSSAGRAGGYPRAPTGRHYAHVTVRIMIDPLCEVCGERRPDAVERPVPLRTLACNTCWNAVTTFPEREPLPPAINELVEQLDEGLNVDVRAGSPTTCRDCGAAGSWHRTVNGRWIILEPGDYPIGKVPSGRRWRVAGDGTAVNLRSALPTDSCRITHFDVCPAGPEPADAPFLRAVWLRNAGGPEPVEAKPAGGGVRNGDPSVDRADVMNAVDCPRCGAPAGEPCLRRDRITARISLHRARWDHFDAFREVSDGRPSRGIMVRPADQPGRT